MSQKTFSHVKLRRGYSYLFPFKNASGKSLSTWLYEKVANLTDNDTSKILNPEKMNPVKKQFLLLIITGMIFISCKDGPSTKTEESTPIAPKMDYPYIIEHPDNWETGSQQNTFNALSALKAWENKNTHDCLSYFADSVQVRFDGISETVSKDTLKAIIAPDKRVKNIAIKMHDWQSSISKDKQEEWVSLWYTQYAETTNGDKDSIDVFNDIKMKDGKIIRLDEYRRRLH